MVSVLDSGFERPGFESWLGQSVMFGRNLLNLQYLSPPRSTIDKQKSPGKPGEILGANLAMDYHPIQGGEVALLVTSC